MWNLPIPSNEDAIVELTSALTYKNGKPKYPLEKKELIIIRSIYERYDELRGRAHDDLIAAHQLSEATKDAIHNGYNEIQKNGRLEDLRSRLMLSVDRCPCCSIGPVTDLDHHLPRSKFKAIAVYSRNLIPLCHTCNNKKRAVEGTEPGQSFIHSYYDIIPKDCRVFIAQTEMVVGALTVNFDILKVDSLSEEAYNMLKFQIKRVDLNNRLRKEVNVFLSSYAVNLDCVYRQNQNSDEVKRLLLANEEHFNNRMGLNDWRSALLSSLANNIEFCDGGFKSALGLV